VNKKTSSSGGGPEIRRLANPPIPFWERIPLWAYFVVGGLFILGLTIGLPTYFSNRHMSQMAQQMAQESGPGVATLRVGDPAPGFSLRDPYGQSYTLSPGDGKAHVLVIYMGYF